MERAREASRTSRPAAGAAVVAGGALFVGALFTTVVLRGVGGHLGAVDIVATAPMLATQAVGLLIAARRPGNRMGWILCALGLVLAIQSLLAAVLLTDAIDGPWFTVALWVDGKSFLLLWGAVIAVLLHFPTGALPSPRWRFVSVTAVAAVIFGVVFSALRPGPLAEDAPAGVANPQNPTAIPDLYAAVGFLEPVGLLLLVAALLASLASLVVRYRSSGPVQRLQIRWVVAACALFVVALLVNVVVRHVAPGWLDIADTAAGLAFTLIPLAVGIAILRRRLYDIDRVLNRTAVYTMLTLVLGAAYVLAVTTMRVLTGPMTGDSAIAVAASTLAVAALFRPARRRIQDAVDQRFNRARYDAAATVAGFSTRLRDEIDLDSLRSELLGVIASTMQPTAVQLWLRGAQA